MGPGEAIYVPGAGPLSEWWHGTCSLDKWSAGYSLFTCGAEAVAAPAVEPEAASATTQAKAETQAVPHAEAHSEWRRLSPAGSTVDPMYHDALLAPSQVEALLAEAQRRTRAFDSLLVCFGHGEVGLRRLNALWRAAKGAGAPPLTAAAFTQGTSCVGARLSAELDAAGVLNYSRSVQLYADELPEI